ncbi:MAG TPA: glutamine amidotransferase family protein [Stellaceae bacterium]|nr:glutamine amidotransferase family protein [Stellaceae bacterium]
MCGIVGLFFKRGAATPALGPLLAGMLSQMGERGPDSTGFALYGDPAPAGAFRVTLHAPDDQYDWRALEGELGAAFSFAEPARYYCNHAVLTLGASQQEFFDWLDDGHRELGIFGFGERIEVFKDVGLPDAVTRRFDLAHRSGTHALGHTRMATESAVTTEHSHPFSTGLDLCLVHNGSLSNHNRVRQSLRREGIRFATDNDTEVAAGYLTWRLAQGMSLTQALETALADLDGFYTFAVGTRDGFAILRDQIACKPAVLAETGDWVAMATEYRAIATLPGAADAEIWEPRPATVYSWQRQ